MSSVQKLKREQVAKFYARIDILRHYAMMRVMNAAVARRARRARGLSMFLRPQAD